MLASVAFSVAWLASKAASACLRSVMSRCTTVYRRWPATLTCEIDASTGNSVPSARRARTSRCAPICRAGPPLSPNCRIWPACAPRKRCGMKRSRGAPTMSSTAQPNIRPAAWLALATWNCSSTVMMASRVDSKTPRSRPSLNFNAWAVRSNCAVRDCTWCSSSCAMARWASSATL